MLIGEGIRSVREQIAERLRAEILSGRLSEGERLQEANLANQFGVSRGIIREVLAHLTQEGLLEAKLNCGVKVAPSDPDSVRELIVPMRRLIETYALKHFFADINEHDFHVWDSILHHLKRACHNKDVAAIIQYDLAFHRSLLVRAGIPTLLTIWQTIVARIRRHFREETMHYGDNLLEIYEQHQRLVDVFRSGDKEAAVKALEDHIW
jgi:DNA-binding GntR family transcriptional regulator